MVESLTSVVRRDFPTSDMSAFNTGDVVSGSPETTAAAASAENKPVNTANRRNTFFSSGGRIL